ncbi:nitroreductase family protein [Clostridium frigidicarnis]|uniref:Nitroreductase n=1 Tax=Clostridium frigidicarnis TaxID=84698 RepID=A0A1I0V7Q0_9CLOT|nr:nitroreductase [Clostridium frigidicarnis]SFA72093.1 Nitroreductase [Clostridium frigidicarnis]
MTKDILEVVKERRSIRSYKEDQIKEEELETILEGGIWAPSGTNEQAWHFTVIQNKELTKEISDKTKTILSKSENEYIRKLGENEKLHIFYNAPTVILISGNEKAITPMEDTSAAVQNMLLVAESLSIGTCWIGTVASLFSDPEVGNVYREKCGIPEEYKVMHSISVGYKKIENVNPPERKKNKVNYIR